MTLRGSGTTPDCKSSSVSARRSTCRATATASDVCPDDGLRTSLFSAVVHLLLRAAARTPLLVVLDDLHRADDATLDLLSHLLAQIDHARVLVIAMMRPLRLPPARHAALARLRTHPRARGLVLGRLAECDVAEFLTQAGRTADSRLARAIHADSQGHPFLMAELTRQWLVQGPVGAPDRGLMEIGRECVRNRLLAMMTSANDLLSVAAVNGRSFDLTLLAAVTGSDLMTVTACLDEAIVVDLCVSGQNADEFSFAHPLYQKVLYLELPPAARRAWHLRIATVLAERSATSHPAPASQIAHHLYEALPDSNLRQTVHWCREAARVAATTSSQREVVRHTQHALEALHLLERPSVRLRMQLLDTLVLFARPCDAALYRRAAATLMALALRQRDARMILRAALLCSPHPGFSPLGSTADALNQALTLLPEGESGMRACALAALATSAAVGFTERAYGLIDEAVSLSRASAKLSDAYVPLLHQAYLYGGPAHGARAQETAHAVELLAQENPRTMPMLGVDVALQRAVIGSQRGEHGAVRGALDGGMLRARKQGNAELIWHVARARAVAKLNGGRSAQGGLQLEALHTQAQAEGLFGTAAFCAFDRAVSMRSFRVVPAEDGEQRKALTYDPAEPPSLWAMKLRALATVGLTDEARATLHVVRTPADLRRLPCDVHYLGTLGHVAQSVLRIGAWDYAAVLYELLAPYEGYFCVQLSFYCEGAVPYVRGLLARGLGRVDEAVTLFTQGITMTDQAGFGPLAAQARLELARCLSARGRGDDRKRARQLARDIVIRAKRLGMHGLLADTATFMMNSGLTTGRVADEPSESLRLPPVAGFGSAS